MHLQLEHVCMLNGYINGTGKKRLFTCMVCSEDTFERRGAVSGPSCMHDNRTGHSSGCNEQRSNDSAEHFECLTVK